MLAVPEGLVFLAVLFAIDLPVDLSPQKPTVVPVVQVEDALEPTLEEDEPEEPAAPPVKRVERSIDERIRLKEAAQAQAAEEAASEAVSVKIEGPKESIIGDGCVFTLAERGVVLDRKWTLIPAEEQDGLFQLDEGRRALFTSRNPGAYAIVVSVSGADGSVAHHVFAFTLRHELPPALLDAIDNGAIIETEPDDTAAAEPEPEHPEQISLNDLIHAWAVEVQSPHRREEARILAGSFRGTATLAGQGQLAGDPIATAYAQCRLALGDQRFRAWQPFFGKLQAVFVQLQQAGALRNPAAVEASLSRVADILLRVE